VQAELLQRAFRRSGARRVVTGVDGVSDFDAFISRKPEMKMKEAAN
jgi:hypothetical protein